MVIDVLSAFDEVMRTGRLSVPKHDDDPQGIPGGWAFVFDQTRYVGAFRQAVGCPVHVLPFDAPGGIPGLEMIELLTAEGAATMARQARSGELPGIRNARLAPDAVWKRYARTLNGHMREGGGVRKLVSAAFESRVISPRLEQALRLELSERFGHDDHAVAGLGHEPF